MDADLKASLDSIHAKLDAISADVSGAKGPPPAGNYADGVDLQWQFTGHPLRNSFAAGVDLRFHSMVPAGYAGPVEITIGEVGDQGTNYVQWQLFDGGQIVSSYGGNIQRTSKCSANVPASGADREIQFIVQFQHDSNWAVQLNHG